MSVLTAEEVKVRRCYSWVHPQPCFHGYCPYCRKTLTAFDFDEESCRQVGAGKPFHDCVQRPDQQRLRI